MTKAHALYALKHSAVVCTFDGKRPSTLCRYINEPDLPGDLDAPIPEHGLADRGHALGRVGQKEEDRDSVTAHFAKMLSDAPQREAADIAAEPANRIKFVV
jgi:hypothetical protein